MCLALGYAAWPLVPPILDMWTSSYGLLTAGWSCLIFLLFYWFIDVRGHRIWSFPFVVIGSNAIFVYMFTSLIPVSEKVGIFTRGIAGGLGALGPLLHSLSVLAVEWLILFWMWKRKIFIKA